MNVTDLIPQVRIVINEMATVEDTFTAEVDTALRQFLQTAMVQIASMPLYRGTPATLTGDSSVTWQKRPDGLFYATIKCGEDFLRPLSVILAGWVRPAHVFLPVNGRKFLAQYSSAPGIGNGPASPVAFIAKDPDTRIIAHASKTEGTCELRYIPVPRIGTDGTLDVPDIYRDALVYTASGLYLQSVNEYDAAKAAFDTAASLIETINQTS